MDITKRKWVAIVSAVLLGLAGAGTGLAWPRSGPPNEQQPERPTDADPPAKVVRPPRKEENSFAKVFATAFPDIKVPDQKDSEALPTRCPHLFGRDNQDLVETADDIYRRLLKAQLRAGRNAIEKFNARIEIGCYSSLNINIYYICLDDMRLAATELWAEDAKTLIPWLEEVVVMGKVFEQYTEGRVRNGVDQPQLREMAVRYRAKFEAALWEAKNPKAARH